MSRLIAIFVWVVVSAGAAFGQGQGTPARPIAIVLDDGLATTRHTVTSGIQALGGRVLHTFDDLLVVELPAGRELRAYRLRGVRTVIMNAQPASRGKGATSSFGLAVWNGIAGGAGDADFLGTFPQLLQSDALTPPEVSIESVRAASRAASSQSGRRIGSPLAAQTAASGAPFGATELNTSEFLAGSISVNVILVESDGTLEIQSENWSEARETEVVSKVAAGLEWVRLQEPQAEIRFVYHVYAGRTDPRARTGYEPIRHVADPNGATGEDLWVKDVLGRFGYASGDRFARSRAFASDTRAADGTDWAVNVFVVDSLVDTDGKFADGRFAYTWIGGPHVVMTYDNQTWGISRMDMVLRHEFLHAFYSFDEYAVSFCTCTEHRGYLDGANANCVNCNPVAGACVMIANGDAMCSATRRQIGWSDLDGDGMIDVLGEDPDTFLDPLPPAVCAAPVVSGVASVVAATNRNNFTATPHASISLNRLLGVEVRADDAPWSMAQAEGGSWGEPQARFSAAFPGLTPGVHRLEARAVDDHGNTDPVPGSGDVTVYAALTPLGSSVRAGKSGGAAVVMTWQPCGGAKRYRVYRRSAPGAAESVVAETAETAWTDSDASSGYYQIRPVDACGDERND